MPSNQNRQGRLGLSRSNPRSRISGFDQGDWQKKRLTFEPFAASEVWETVRPEQVARAKTLVLASDYPTEEVMRSIARLLARHLEV
jgi:hypothetical protein